MDTEKLDSTHAEKAGEAQKNVESDYGAEQKIESWGWTNNVEKAETKKKK
ncbi:hypothetical protein P4V54_02400 [Brevibacillus nitrificans]|nr:hypothetical protein [Brevibacillus nitrificans]